MESLFLSLARKKLLFNQHLKSLVVSKKTENNFRSKNVEKKAGNFSGIKNKTRTENAFCGIKQVYILKVYAMWCDVMWCGINVYDERKIISVRNISFGFHLFHRIFFFTFTHEFLHPQKMDFLFAQFTPLSLTLLFLAFSLFLLLFGSRCHCCWDFTFAMCWLYSGCYLWW